VDDISALGVALTLLHPVVPGTLLEVDLECLTRGVLRTLQARVVHTRAGEDGGWVIGCGFTRELGDAELRRFRAQRLRPRGPDNRRWVRFPCDVETACYTRETAPGERWPARVLNISAGGVGLLLPCQFAEGTLLFFEVPPVAGLPAGRVLVRIVRTAGQADGNWFLGCEFARRLSAQELGELL
jgi:hypothetical protein